MFTIRRRTEGPSVDANRLIARLEDEFDLLRLQKHGADLKQREAALADEAERLRHSLEVIGLAEARVRWWHVLTTRISIFWLEFWRERLAEKRRWYRSLEEEIRFGLRLTNARSPAPFPGRIGDAGE